MAAKFYLKHPSEENSSIFLKYNYTISNKSTSLKYYFSTSIPTKFWNTKTQRVKSSKSFPSHHSINQLINKLSELVDSQYRNLIAKGITPTKELLKAPLDEYLGKSQPNHLVVDFLDKWVERQSRAKQTIKNETTFCNHFKKFQALEKANWTFDDLDYSWYLRFVQYFQSCNLQSGHIAKLTSTLKLALKTAKQQGLHNNIAYIDFKPKDLNNVTKKTSMYLTLDEIKQIETYQANTPALILARQLALIAFYTGFRYKDIVSINPESFRDRNGTKTIVNTMTKTNRTIEIPVHPNLIPIFKELNWTVPYVSNQYGNRLFKELCAACEINENFTFVENKGGNITFVTKPKHAIVSWHTFRRSAITAYKQLGGTLEDASKFAGHSKIQTTQNYFKETTIETALRLSKDPFFKQ